MNARRSRSKAGGTSKARKGPDFGPLGIAASVLCLILSLLHLPTLMRIALLAIAGGLVLWLTLSAWNLPKMVVHRIVADLLRYLKRVSLEEERDNAEADLEEAIEGLAELLDCSGLSGSNLPFPLRRGPDQEILSGYRNNLQGVVLTALDGAAKAGIADPAARRLATDPKNAAELNRLLARLNLLQRGLKPAFGSASRETTSHFSPS
jgi:hypothetical protein